MHPTSNDFAGQRCSIISNQFLTLIVIEIRFPSVPNIEICTQYLMSQIICSWEIKVRNQSLCKYWWKHIFIFKVLFLVYTTYIICIAWIHQPAIEIIIHMKTVFTFVVQEREDSLQMNVNFYSWLSHSICEYIFLIYVILHIKVSLDSQNWSQNCENVVNLPHIDRPVNMKMICKKLS